MRGRYLGKSTREGKRRDGTASTYYNVSLMADGAGAGQLGVSKEIYDFLDKVPFGAVVEFEMGAQVWNGRIEARPRGVQVVSEK